MHFLSLYPNMERDSRLEFISTLCWIQMDNANANISFVITTAKVEASTQHLYIYGMRMTVASSIGNVVAVSGHNYYQTKFSGLSSINAMLDFEIP